jgi:hypothetical protein
MYDYQPEKFFLSNHRRVHHDVNILQEDSSQILPLMGFTPESTMPFIQSQQIGDLPRRAVLAEIRGCKQ